MKGIIKQQAKNTSDMHTPQEFLIVGIEWGYYYIVDSAHNFCLEVKENVEITDHERPSFWIEEHDRSVPEEWLSENLLYLSDDLSEEWDEIWAITQFAKGLSKFNLPVIPLNLKKAYDQAYKADTVSHYLQICSDYDSLFDKHDHQHVYKFGPFNFSRAEHGWIGVDPEPFEKKLISDKSCGFDVVRELLKNIGKPLTDAGYRIDEGFFNKTRTRILFSIWSVFATKHFEVYQIVPDSRQTAETTYILKLDDQCYYLSFAFFY